MTENNDIRRMSPAEYQSAVEALGYRLDRSGAMAMGAYRAGVLGVSYSIKAIGEAYGRKGRWTSYANVDAPRDRLPELQALRSTVTVESSGRVWELLATMTENTQRTLPDGQVKEQGPYLTRRKALTGLAYNIIDNGLGSRVEAMVTAARLEDKPDGESVEIAGYTFRLVKAS